MGADALTGFLLLMAATSIGCGLVYGYCRRGDRIRELERRMAANRRVRARAAGHCTPTRDDALTGQIEARPEPEPLTLCGVCIYAGTVGCGTCTERIRER